jgi:hypothetical protein
LITISDVEDEEDYVEDKEREYESPRQRKEKNIKKKRRTVLLIEENIFETIAYDNSEISKEDIYYFLASLSLPIIMIISNSLQKEDQYSLERLLSFSQYPSNK